MSILNSRAWTLPHSDFPISDDGLLSPGAAETRLIHALQSRFREMALAAGSEERLFPTVIAEEILDRSEYFQSFPQYASAVNSPKKKSKIFSVACSLLPLLPALDELRPCGRHSPHVPGKMFSC
jgi:hypothetical protein